ncbi:MAG: sugar phosphate isomerase/epimerase family protein [Mycobacteriales bacterium]
MIFGFSSYCFRSPLGTGEMTLLDVIDWVADSEGEHLELASISTEPDNPVPNSKSDDVFVKAVADRAAERGVPLSNLAIGANFFTDDEAARRQQIAHVKAHVDLAAALGITRMRHDVVRHSPEAGDDTPTFERAFPLIVSACKEIARYAARKGVTTSLENHGFFVQASDRVRRIVHAVEEPNFKTTLDIGNFLCVDEDPTSAVPANLPLALTVHLKDFYVRPADRNPGEGWFRSRGGKYLRGAIVGNGDIDTYAVMKSIKESGYDGLATIEFEGDEDWRIGTTRGLANAKRIYAEV